MHTKSPKTLKEWWDTLEKLQKEGKAKVVKLRYEGWDHRIKFFSPHSVDEKKGTISGELDTGEVIAFRSDSHFWVTYDEGMEEDAKAI